MKEAELTKDLKHEYIIGFEEAFISDENEYSLKYNIVTELAEGGTLYDKNDNEPFEHQDLQKAVW